MRRADLLTILQRFWNNVDKDADDACWVWTGEKNNQGYGTLSLYFENRRQRIFAHRLSFVMANGGDITDLVVMHTCDNPPCVNPAHLRSGVQFDNMRDALAKNRLNLSGLAIGQAMPSPCANAKKTHCKRGHEFTEENTYRDKKGRRCRACAFQYERQRTRIRREQGLSQGRAA